MCPPGRGVAVPVPDAAETPPGRLDRVHVVTELAQFVELIQTRESCADDQYIALLNGHFESPSFLPLGP